MSKIDQATTTENHSKPFIVARNAHVLPKARRIERLGSGYTIRESSEDSQGDYWFVVAAFEVGS